MSDLHLERIKYDFTISKAAPVLVLAGDIGQFCHREPFQAFLQTQCEKFDMVLLVAGNHEFYGSSRSEGLRIAQEMVNSPAMLGRLHFLNRTRIDLPDTDVTVLGCTLHSHIAPDYTKLTNDFATIKEWRVRDHNAEHELDRTWLKESLAAMANEAQPRRVVIVTHYAPAYQKTSHPMHERSDLSQCFCSDTLHDLKSWPGAGLVCHWVFGHTHWNTLFKHGHITVQSNQLCSEPKNLSWWQKHMLFRPFDGQATIQL